ncbi:GspE/PulE/PilB domain-containing protein [Brunnivagina elsteri]|uniref:Pilus assembly protein PilB n=1 Tax=Brunnivagina elsteri CCALA 953 TaxID=987040 RepID=A0A2A2TMJ9_9CYAN|nr:pilus assembly protein PilB [Calothrix elsteri]PAX59570.1 pilus assembly protein PilB [Calothrix elsteri CCALA 953]
MLSSEGKQTDTEALGEKVSPDTEFQWDKKSEREQVIHLIETFLSFEACLYHQILPLRFEDKSLILGMVNPDDETALDYVSRILSYVNCTMVIQQMSADNHRSILSAYLNYKNTSQSAPGQLPSPKAYAEELLIPSGSQVTQSDSYQVSQIDGSQVSSVPILEAVAIEQKIEQKPVETTHQYRQYIDTSPNPRQNSTSASVFEAHLHKTGQEQDTDITASTQIPSLRVTEADELTPVELLPTLPPKRFLEELLGRVIVGGIGRLYFERLPYEGKILWSENGVLQSVLEKLPLSVFQGALNELKKFANWRVTTLSEPKQIEKEYIYKQQRLLLRLRVMPGMYGEEATLQVLRGAALKFYQQQQLSRISRDALGISQQLSYKLHELQERMLSNRNVNTERLETLSVLNKLLTNLDNQIKTLSDSEENHDRG